MLIVAGLTLRSIEPRVWDKASLYYLSDLQAVMFSYAEIHQMPKMREQLMLDGFRKTFGIPSNVKIYLDNGAFGLSRKGLEIPVAEYEEFVEKTKPDWRPVPRDFIPAPSMSRYLQKKCMRRTMDINIEFQHDGFVPVIHISQVINNYIAELQSNEKLTAKPNLAIGGIVPNLLRSPKAISHEKLLKSLLRIRKEFINKKIHIFGIGGISTLHLASVLEIDSVDSSGWRNRAARGIILLPGKSERSIAELGSWKGRKMSKEEADILNNCKCPPCKQFGVDGLTVKATKGFRNRATHNLWTLLQEEKWIKEQMKKDLYFDNYHKRVEKSAYRNLIDELLKKKISQQK